LVVTDEAPMQHCHGIKALDHTLRDILDNQLPFGGIIIIFGGDFHQTTPVVPRGSRQCII
ncbi:hypothetical protein SERLA73DRAFT_28485, partial [Serpula lacrymans var. lacrymans S7.3]